MKIELELSDKPEVHYISSALNLDPDAVVGKLVRVWAWFDKHTLDGNAIGVTYSLLDRITGVSGFGEMMCLAGWMEQRDKILHMPHFERHTSESAKKRALTSKRVAKFRTENGNATSVTKTLPEKRREEVNTSALPEWLPKDAWASFVEMRKKQRQPFTDRAVELLVGKLEKLKHAGQDPVLVLEQSVLNGWKDLFPVKNGLQAVSLVKRGAV